MFHQIGASFHKKKMFEDAITLSFMQEKKSNCFLVEREPTEDTEFTLPQGCLSNQEGGYATFTNLSEAEFIQ